MFGHFFDKTNNKAKNCNENIKDTSPKSNNKLQIHSSTSIVTNQSFRINSISPSHNASRLQGSNYSPVNSQPSPEFKYSKEQRRFSPVNPFPKQNENRLTNTGFLNKNS